MSKTKTLFTMALLVLLGSMGAAQAQNIFYEIKLFTTPADFAREGGKSEVSGDILLNFDPIPQDTLTATLEYSVPLATDMGGDATTSINSTLVGMAEDEDNNDNGTITVSAFGGNTANLLVRNVMLDVSAASGPITVTVTVKSSNDTDFVRIDGQNSAMVIEDIKVGVLASAKAETVRTRGTGAGGMMVSLTLKESFKGAFMAGNRVTVDFSGIPEGVTLGAIVTSNPVAMPDAAPAVVLDEMDPYADAGAVKDGSVTVTLGGTGDMIDNRPAPASVKLELTLTAAASNKKISLPLTPGSVMAKASFTDESGGADNFADAFTDYVTVFNIRPAQCELLFPVVTVMGDWNTAISVTNPAYGDDPASGALTFTFYGQEVMTEPPMFQTSAGSPGTGLSDDGTLAAGGTYQVMANQILAATDWGTSFVGHVYLLADYTNCSGVGWVTDFMGVNQAYTATVIDADTGSDPE